MHPVGMKGSCLVPMCEVVVLSATMDEMEPCRTPLLMMLLRAVVSFILLELSCGVMFSCSLI